MFLCNCASKRENWTIGGGEEDTEERVGKREREREQWLLDGTAFPVKGAMARESELGFSLFILHFSRIN